MATHQARSAACPWITSRARGDREHFCASLVPDVKLTWRAWRASASYVTGAHNMKFGLVGNYYRNKTDSYTNNQRLSYRFNNGVPNQLTMSGLRFVTDSHTAPLGVYAQEQWTLGRLTLQGGLRYDGRQGHAGPIPGGIECGGDLLGAQPHRPHIHVDEPIVDRRERELPGRLRSAEPGGLGSPDVWRRLLRHVVRAELREERVRLDLRSGADQRVGRAAVQLRSRCFGDAPGPATHVARCRLFSGASTATSSSPTTGP